MIDILLLMFGVSLLGYTLIKNNQTKLEYEESLSNSVVNSETSSNLIDLLKEEILILEDRIRIINNDNKKLTEENVRIKEYCLNL